MTTSHQTDTAGVVRAATSRPGRSLAAAGVFFAAAAAIGADFAARPHQAARAQTRAADELERRAGAGLDLNRASAGDLASVPEMGPVLARRLVAFRRRVAPFATVDDLLLVPGIGQNRLARIRHLVRVEPCPR